MTAERLNDAEVFIEKHYRQTADEFEEYKHIKPFQFLPGHNALILGMKLEINDIFSQAGGMNTGESMHCEFFLL